MNNTRFPHRVIIKRLSGGSAFGGATESQLYDGECRNYRNLHTKEKNGVLISDYTLALPKIDFEVKELDIVEVTTETRTMTGTVKDYQVNNFGTNIWWNKTSN